MPIPGQLKTFSRYAPYDTKTNLNVYTLHYGILAGRKVYNSEFYNYYTNFPLSGRRVVNRWAFLRQTQKRLRTKASPTVITAAIKTLNGWLFAIRPYYSGK